MPQNSTSIFTSVGKSPRRRIVVGASLELALEAA
jgi:hypothetical protein